MNIRVAIVEDVEHIRKGLASLLNGSEGFRCDEQYTSGEDALRNIPLTKPDVVLMDIHMPGMSGVECVRQLKAQCPHIQFVMSTVYEDNENIFQSLKAGATGYLLKKTQPSQILEAISDVYHGGSPMSWQIARKVINSFYPDKKTIPDASLSIREKEILELLGKGLRYKEIAASLFISMDTVRTHVRNIYEKLQVHSRTEALNKLFPRT
jgi:DNA-binding NarL/FixJ family response regulator